MILLIDTSASSAVVAMLDGRISELNVASRSNELMPVLRRIVGSKREIEKVAVVAGLGSFTGLRVGVSFAVGLAMGRGIPMVPLGSLELQAARSEVAVTAVVEAGRGRFYFRVGEGPHELGDAAEIPRSLELVGNVSDKGQAVLSAAGHRFRPRSRLLLTGAAALKLLEQAKEVAYGSLEIEYMQSFRARG